MDDDFNTALAIAALFDLARSLNSYVSAGAPDKKALEAALEGLLKLSGTLGLILEDEAAEDQELDEALAALLASLESPGAAAEGAEKLMEKLLTFSGPTPCA